jgi:ADP-ribose pyrophosphatase YjhB (NUDIX family)
VLIRSDTYAKIIGLIPILCVDGIIRNSKNQVLLVKRNNEPLKGKWWVPGGRVHKGESLERAFRRKMREELGLKIRHCRCVGYYEGRRLRDSRSIHDRFVHTVSFVFEAQCTFEEVRVDSQSSGWTFANALPARFKVLRF